MMGNGKNTIPSPKRLQPLASRPQVRTLGAIIYFDVPNPSGVCFNSFYLSCWPAIQDLNAVGLFLLNLANKRSRNDLPCRESTRVEPSPTQASQIKQGLRPGGEEISFFTIFWDSPQKLQASGPRAPLAWIDARYFALGIASCWLSTMSLQILRQCSQIRADFICFEFTTRRTLDSDFPQKEQLFIGRYYAPWEPVRSYSS